MKLVIYKDKSFKTVEDGVSFEYENDPNYFVTLEIKIL